MNLLRLVYKVWSYYLTFAVSNVSGLGPFLNEWLELTGKVAATVQPDSACNPSAGLVQFFFRARSCCVDADLPRLARAAVSMSSETLLL